MALEVECPNCRALLRPSEELVARGGEHPCPQCQAPLHIVVEPEPPRERSRRPRRRMSHQSANTIPGWVWAAGAGVVMLLILVIGAVLLLALGRGRVFGPPRLTPEQFAKVQPGMSPNEVRRLLGAPTQQLDSNSLFASFGKSANMRAEDFPRMLMMIWTDRRTYTATVQFVDDKATFMVWNDGTQETNPLGNFHDMGR